MELQTLGMIIGAVVLVAALLYVMDRRSKAADVDYTDLAKIAGGAGVVTSGVVYAIGTDQVEEVVKTATEAAQEMFVGKPTF